MNFLKENYKTFLIDHYIILKNTSWRTVSNFFIEKYYIVKWQMAVNEIMFLFIRFAVTNIAAKWIMRNKKCGWI